MKYLKKLDSNQGHKNLHNLNYIRTNLSMTQDPLNSTQKKTAA
jgi:hypothetical protein